jgi:hypothetical protein
MWHDEALWRQAGFIRRPALCFLGGVVDEAEFVESAFACCAVKSRHTEHGWRLPGKLVAASPSQD